MSATSWSQKTPQHQKKGDIWIESGVLTGRSAAPEPGHVCPMKAASGRGHILPCSEWCSMVATSWQPSSPCTQGITILTAWGGHHSPFHLAHSLINKRFSVAAASQNPTLSYPSTQAAVLKGVNNNQGFINYTDLFLLPPPSASWAGKQSLLCKQSLRKDLPKGLLALCN